MPHVNILLHAVWATKARTPWLVSPTRKILISHILENAHSKGIQILAINGYIDHLHCLFVLNADMSLAKAMQLIKGESAHWLNKTQMLPQKFEWGDEYFVVSVSKKDVPSVRRYIDKQESHHRSRGFQEEFESFQKEFGSLLDDKNQEIGTR